MGVDADPETRSKSHQHRHYTPQRKCNNNITPTSSKYRPPSPPLSPKRRRYQRKSNSSSLRRLFNLLHKQLPVPNGPARQRRRNVDPSAGPVSIPHQPSHTAGT